MTASSAAQVVTPPEEGLSATYRVSARRYRPKTFGDVYGQEALVQTLSNGIERGRLPHAFIFTGIRGVGKTTTARILARSLNCIGPDGAGAETLTPCGVCEHCKAIDEDRHLDVIEMDAASRTGVDDVREVIETARYKAVSARYKIYIIDEVHMLSKSAFNALLKTLEEPPAHVKFIFATTEIKKVPQTVLSRCMRFDLKRLSSEKLIQLFTSICQAESVAFEDQALALVARAADGSARDGLSILDQAITSSAAQITAQSVQDMLGLMDKSQLIQLFDSVVGGEAKDALDLFDHLYQSGAEPLSVLRDLLDFTHWLTMIKVSPDMIKDPTLSTVEVEKGQGLAQALTIPVLTRLWQILLKGVEEVQFAPSSLQATRMVLVRLAYVGALPTPDQLSKQLPTTQAQPIESAAPLPKGSEAAEVQQKPELTVVENVEGETAAQAQKALPQERPAPVEKPLPTLSSFQEVVELFGQNHEPLLYSQLMHDVRLVSFTPGEIEMNLCEKAPKDLPLRVTKLLKQWTGQNWVVKISEAHGQASLLDQQQEKDQERLRQVSETPLVKAALEAFPGAAIESISEEKGQTE